MCCIVYFCTQSGQGHIDIQLHAVVQELKIIGYMIPKIIV